MPDLLRAGVSTVVGGLAVGIGVSVVAHLAGHSVRPWLTCVLTVSAAVLVAMLYASGQLIFRAEPVPPPQSERPVLTDRKRGGLDATVRMVERATSDPDRFDVLRARLVRLTDDRLRTRHGVDVRTDSERARALVGDGLVDLVAGRPDRQPGRAELEEWMTRLETL